MGLHGAIAATVTPLRDGGSHLDEDAFAPLTRSSRTAGSTGSSRAAPPAKGSYSPWTNAGGDRVFLAVRPAGF